MEKQLRPFPMNTLCELRRTIGGRLKPAQGTDRDAKATRLGPVVIDSRRVTCGDVFWALRGLNHDGADFADEAFARGASGAIVSRPVETPPGRWVLTVGDTTEALQKWARAHRTRFAGTVIAVTGSVGKTTTREMIHTVLHDRLRGTASSKNYNNHIGVPLSMLRIEPEHDYAVLELGASAPGEIAALAELCAPQIGAITTVGDAHLAGFGSRAAIAESKAELLTALPPDGHAVLGDDPRLRRTAARCTASITWVGCSADCDVAATGVHWDEGRLHFRVERRPFCVPIWGRHHLTSALIAVAIGRIMGLGLDEIAAALEDFAAVPMRCEVTDVCGTTIINDAYNASPTAMRAALELLRDVDARGKRVFVCGDMGELGRHSPALHYRLGCQAVTLGGADVLIACGGFADDVVTGARHAGMPCDHSVACRTPEEAAESARRNVGPGDVVLIKGARSMAMERVVKALEQGLELIAG